MAKEKSEKKDKKAKKEKEKRSEKDGVSKIKKDKKVAENGGITSALLGTLDKHSHPAEVIKSEDNLPIRIPPPLRAMVPFANPLADEKACKKLLKTVKKGALLFQLRLGKFARSQDVSEEQYASLKLIAMRVPLTYFAAAKNKSLKRGVKEVVKSLRKSPTVGAAPGVVILAADISPMDVISHIPVLCEDHNVPYIFVPSRAELGAAGNTKRPTSVVMISAERGGKKKPGAGPEEGEEEFKGVYGDLVKLVEKESRHVKI
ncbi:MAG: snoRNA-binding protein [Trichoglossum hirsutum]|jgi:H/ACA ribonucleoprotein complex subunit 2|nr:MAG: snoRNA-binding protein [Trichoglossum hirsutum]